MRAEQRSTGAAVRRRGVQMMVLGRRVRRGDAAFTFVEVLVVIIILSVLSLIAIATFLGQREKAERSRALSALRNAETFAVAIRADTEGYSECIEDYEREAGQNAPYTWLEDPDAGSTGAGASTDAHEISVFGPLADDCSDLESPGWVGMAVSAGSRCYYNLLVPGSNTRIRHRAEVADPDAPGCEGSELVVSTLDPFQLSFRGADLDEPSGW